MPDPPRRSSATYAVRAPLEAWLVDEAKAASARHPAGARVLDVGCGVKPYAPLFADSAAEYVGIDLESEAADIQAPAERLPLSDGSCDVVLCLQVLEHVERPAEVVGELRRVVAPGGRVLASTHGVNVYHPAPVDLWRWTHTGLLSLFRDNGEWSSVTVTPGAGTTACLGMLVSIYVDLLAKRARVRPLGRPLIAAVNTGAALVDRCFRDLQEPRPGTIFANYHVTATV